MTNPTMPMIRVNLERAKLLVKELERSTYTQLSAYCLEVLHEIGCNDTELPANLQTREQQLNFIAGFASYAFGEMENV